MTVSMRTPGGSISPKPTVSVDTAPVSPGAVVTVTRLCGSDSTSTTPGPWVREATVSTSTSGENTSYKRLSASWSIDVSPASRPTLPSFPHGTRRPGDTRKIEKG